MEMLLNRPVPTGNNKDVDMSLFAGRNELESLLVRMLLVEKRNIEQDDRLTNNEYRISELERRLSDPMDRIQKLEERVDQMSIVLNNKVDIQLMYNELRKKADIDDLKALEASLYNLN